MAGVTLRVVDGVQAHVGAYIIEGALTAETVNPIERLRLLCRESSDSEFAHLIWSKKGHGGRDVTRDMRRRLPGIKSQRFKNLLSGKTRAPPKLFNRFDITNC